MKIAHYRIKKIRFLALVFSNNAFIKLLECQCDIFTTFMTRLHVRNDNV